MTSAAKPRVRVIVDESAVGVGKTYNAIKSATLLPGRYLFVVERRDAVNEIAQRIGEAASSSVAVVKIVSDEAARGYSVRQEVEALPERYPDGHLIAICTHQAMMMSDLSAFVGWRIIIDEAPNVLTQQQVQSKCDRAFFEANYALTPLSEAWSQVTLKDAGRKLNGSDLQHDDSHRHLRLFHQRVAASSSDTSRAVICNLPSWAAMGSDNIQWTWWSIFSLNQLEAFETITILANRFMDSITARLLEVWSDDVEWIARSTFGQRKLSRRFVQISYFSERPSSIRFFETEVGQQNLSKIGMHIRNAVSDDGFIWSANDVAAKALNLSSRSFLRPRQAGTDRYMHCTQAAMIYAAKPNQEVRGILRALDVDPIFWTQTAEFETILQFVTRTSIRDVASEATARVYVYSRDQAEYLKRFFDLQSHIDSDVAFIDLDLAYPAVRMGRPPKDEPLSLEDARLKADARRVRRAHSQRLRRAMKRVV